MVQLGQGLRNRMVDVAVTNTEGSKTLPCALSFWDLGRRGQDSRSAALLAAAGGSVRTALSERPHPGGHRTA